MKIKKVVAGILAFSMLCGVVCTDNSVISEMVNTVSVSAESSTVDIIDSDIVLDGNKTFTGDLIIKSGTIELGGYTLTVEGNLRQIGGSLSIQNGTLIVNGSYYISGQAKDTNSGNYYDTEVNANLIMNNNEGVVDVNGDFLMYSSNRHSEYLTAGTMYFGGNFTQYYDNASNNFNCTGTHKVIFDGEEQQNIYFATSNYSGFSHVDMKNTKINLKSYIKPFIIDSDITIDNDVQICIAYDSINDKRNPLQLNGHKLTINGNLYHTAGDIAIQNGTLEVNGDYYIASQHKDTNSGDIVMGEVDASLIMNNNEGVVDVNGDFITYSKNNHSTYLTAGTMYFGGNFTQYSDSSYWSFNCTGTHKVVFDGEEQQNIYFATSNSSGFSHVDMKNTKINLKSYIKPFIIDSDITIDNDVQICIAYDSINDKRNPLQLNGHKLTVNGNLYHTAGDIAIQNGTLEVNGDYYIASQYKDADSGEINYNPVDASLIMQNEKGTVKVTGDFITYSKNNHSTYLTAGELHLGGNFTQYCSDSYGSETYNFNCTEKHRVFLDSTDQNITFYSTNSKFNLLVPSTYLNNYNFIPELCYTLDKENTYLVGDCNHDGKATSDDALYILQVVTGINEVSESDLIFADADEDDTVTSADALKLLQIVVGLE